MTMSLFNQFDSPYMLGMPLMLLAMLLPTLLLSTQHNITSNRLVALQTAAVFIATKQLMLPLTARGHSWAAPLMGLFYYLLALNLLGLMPYTFTPTAQLSMSMALALPLWLMTTVTGLRMQPNMSLAHMLPTGTPILLVPVLIIIETVSLLIRPLALGVRLAANLTAGHLLIMLISTTTIIMLQTHQPLTLITLLLTLLLMSLEIAVAMIQAYVFTLLLSLYLQENT